MKKVGSTVQKQFVWFDSLRPAAELNSSGAIVSQFVYGLKGNVPDYIIKGSVRYKVMTDHLGSVVAVVHSTNGTVAQRIEYDEFGKILSDTSPGFQPFGFAGGLYDPDTKLTLFGARSYDAEIGRWLSKDPIGFNGGDTNLYGYVLQDPINLIDPEGKTSRRPGQVMEDIAGGGGGGRGSFTPNQSALVDLARQAQSRGSISRQDARTLLDWAKEYRLRGRIDPPHPGSKTDFPHLHIGPKNHIPICE